MITIPIAYCVAFLLIHGFVNAYLGICGGRWLLRREQRKREQALPKWPYAHEDEVRHD
jgi:hypothetical protein